MRTNCAAINERPCCSFSIEPAVSRDSRLKTHAELTGSPRAKAILADFSNYLPKFKKILPHDYDRMLRLIAQAEEKGLDNEQAQLDAFYAMQEAGK